MAVVSDIASQELYNLNEDEFFRSFEGGRAFRLMMAELNLESVNGQSETVHAKNTIYTKYIKRLFDIVISFGVLLVTLPINLVIAAITYFDVGKPIIFKQKRLGKDGEEFEIVKFRNMTNATDQNGNLLPPSQRVTKFGRFVRKTSLDELLNFWSILKGDMSLIGPRPLVIAYGLSLSKRHEQRHAVRPGLECPFLKQPETKITWAEQFEHDIWYVENVSFKTDLMMIVALLRLVFDRKGTAMRSEASRGTFMGYNEDGTTINAKEVPGKYIQKFYETYKTKDCDA